MRIRGRIKGQEVKVRGRDHRVARVGGPQAVGTRIEALHSPNRLAGLVTAA